VVQVKTIVKTLIYYSSLILITISCSDIQTENISTHSVPFDLEPITESDDKSDGLTDRFDQEWLMSDLFFLNTGELTADNLQAFFEDSPYGGKSWLADFTFSGVPMSQVIIEQAHKSGVNPLILLVRMQVEQSLVSRSVAPFSRVSNAALGCGCHDGERCAPQFKGMENQLRCAGNTFRTLFDQSRQKLGLWQAGKARRTLDPILVRPVNHATAAMYGYTPWVLKGRGGNWLAWNITRKFIRYMKERDLVGAFNETDLVTSAELGNLAANEWSADELSACLYRSERAFIGDPCGCQRDCDFYSGSSQGFCHSSGFCSLKCEGSCPDILNRAQTFCIEDSQSLDVGICVPKASELNGHCADLPKTIDDQRERFIGGSSAPPSSAEVCAPF
jgi:hypothetical protein